MTKVKGVSKITDEIVGALSEYTTEVEEGLEETQKEVAKETVKQLKRTSPELTGSYASGWRAKKTINGYTIHNKTDYQLTHLLEKPHAKRGGGQTTPQPHIGPAEKKAIEEYIERTEDVIKG